MNGDTAVVGALNKTTGANTKQGAAYVFTRSGMVWAQQQELTAADGTVNDEFGNTVAVNGDTIIVGALGKTVGANVGQGAAYIFARSGTVWTQQQELTAPDGSTNDLMGVSVSVSGDIAVIGAFGQVSLHGAAYVFTRSGGVGHCNRN